MHQYIISYGKDNGVHNFMYGDGGLEISPWSGVAEEIGGVRSCIPKLNYRTSFTVGRAFYTIKHIYAFFTHITVSQ